MIKLCEPDITKLEQRYIGVAVLEKELSGESKYIPEFEQRFADFIGTKYAIAVSSGWAALFLSFHLIARNKRVLIPDITMIATANAAKSAGAEVVLSEVDERGLIGYSNDADVSVPVHLHGQVAQVGMKDSKLCIEDCAEAHGAMYGDKKVGSIGTVGCFSFYGNKIMTTGEGGMITTGDEGLADELRKLRSHYFGKERFLHPKLGFNFRMTGLQAALGIAQLTRIKTLLERRRECADDYFRRLKDVVRCYPIPENEVCWFYVIYTEKREELAEFLLKNGIETRKNFIPLHKQPEYFDPEGDYCVSDRLSRTGLLLPHTISPIERELICEKIKEFFNQ